MPRRWEREETGSMGRSAKQTNSQIVNNVPMDRYPNETDQTDETDDLNDLIDNSPNFE
jgi:hypothetical protein